ncbi:DUF4397 domain-containing protein [Halobacillus sp. A5]|uniref:DUF4397 domain-containing protein n=1 Tax=Halobacillus sp. A5 TaxID=2880263 RepID=UPI0020A67ACC|nr:DUF4397 domain-containing protein [Halobacillus sp. A5]MCP3027194.1 DUF4397 domain-containing protein [Halobacillus sp. A5]
MNERNTNQLAQQAAQYDLLADYYKYIDPNRHIYYYQKHLETMQQLINDSQRHNMMGMNDNAMVRVLHASPDAPSVDAYVNGQKVLEGFSYEEQSDYLSVPGGQYQIDIFPEGESNRPVLSQMIEIDPGRMYTVAAAGRLDELELIAAIDSEGVSPGRAKVRFWHLSPDAPEVDVAVKGGDVLFRNVPFGKSTRYVALPPTTADLEVRAAGTNNVVLHLLNISLNPNQVYTFAAVGFAEDDPALEALILKP